MGNTHSFGGRALDRLMFDFETVEGGGTESDAVAAAFEPAGAEVGAEPSAAESAGAEAGTEETGAPSPVDGGPGPGPEAAPAAPAADGVTLTADEIAEWRETQAMLRQIAAEAARTDTDQPPAAPPRPDPLADDYDEQLDAWFDYEWQRRMGGVQPILQSFQNEQATAVRDKLLDGLSGIDGYEPAKAGHRQAAEAFAGAALDEVKATTRLAGAEAVNEALRRGASQVAALLKAEREAGREEGKRSYMEQIGRVEAAPGELGGGGAGTEIGADAETESEVVERLFSRSRVA